MPDIADKGNDQMQAQLDMAERGRVQYGKWDGKPRECQKCGEMINPRRLESINAVVCVECAV